MESLQISKSKYQRIMAHLLGLHPLEGCGLMAGRNGVVQFIYQISNRLNSPVAFEMDPAEQLAAMLDIEERELELLAIYHSHPHGPARPSSVDIKTNYYPETVQVIVSWSDPDHPTTRAFRIQGGDISEVPFQIR
jgi:proteasome lid subunit RPN8/RPN11